MRAFIYVATLIMLFPVFVSTAQEQNQPAETQVSEVDELKAKIAEMEADAEQNEIRNIYYKILFFRNNLSPDVAKKIAVSIYKRCQEYKVDPDLLLALIRVESYFSPRATSWTNAQGLTQCLVIWREVCGKDLYDIDTSVKCGLHVLTEYYDMYHDVKMALLAYNIGPQYIDYMKDHHIRIPQQYYRSIAFFFKDLKSVGSQFENKELPPDYLTIR